MFLSLFMSTFFFQDEQKAAAMVGLTEEGPPEVDTEEVKHMVPSVKWLLCVLSHVKILFLSWPTLWSTLVAPFFLDSLFNKISVDTIEFVFCS